MQLIKGRLLFNKVHVYDWFTRLKVTNLTPVTMRNGTSFPLSQMRKIYPISVKLRTLTTSLKVLVWARLEIQPVRSRVKSKDNLHHLKVPELVNLVSNKRRAALPLESEFCMIWAFCSLRVYVLRMHDSPARRHQNIHKYQEISISGRESGQFPSPSLTQNFFICVCRKCFQYSRAGPSSIEFLYTMPLPLETRFSSLQL